MSWWWLAGGVVYVVTMVGFYYLLSSCPIRYGQRETCPMCGRRL